MNRDMKVVIVIENDVSRYNLRAVVKQYHAKSLLFGSVEDDSFERGSPQPHRVS